MIARQHSCVPVMVDVNQVLMASPNPLDPEVEDELRLRFGMPVRTVLCTPANINDAITKYVPRDASMPEPVTAPIAQAAAAGPAAAAQQAAPAAEAKPKRTGPLTDEEKKERRDYAIMAMGITSIVLMNAMYWGLHRGFLFSAVIVLPIAAIAAGVTWKMKSR